MYWRVAYSTAQEKVMQNVSKDVFWGVEIEGECKLYVGFVQMISDKTRTVLESTVIVKYPIHVVVVTALWCIGSGSVRTG